MNTSYKAAMPHPLNKLQNMLSLVWSSNVKDRRFFASQRLSYLKFTPWLLRVYKYQCWPPTIKNIIEILRIQISKKEVILKL